MRRNQYSAFAGRPVVAKTIDAMVVHHADCLHLGVDDGRADEFETAFGEVFRSAVRQRRFCRAILWRHPCVADRLAIHVGLQE